MFRFRFVVWIAALAATALVTPESHAQKGGAHIGGGGGARGIGSAPRISGGSAPRINAAPKIGSVQPRTISPGAIHPQGIQGNALKGNPSISGINGRPSGALNNLQSARIMPGNKGLQAGNFQPSRFNAQPLHNQQWNNQQWHNHPFHGDNHHHGHNSAFIAFSPFLGLGFWPGFWDTPYYSFYPPFGFYDTPAPYMPYTPDFNPGIVPPTPTPTPMPAGVAIAQIDVFVPDANAQVFFDGSATTSKGSTRYFDSPPLQPGGTYTYTIRAVWNQDGRPMSAESAVTVTAGSQVVLDFTESPPKVTRVR